MSTLDQGLPIVILILVGVFIRVAGIVGRDERLAITRLVLYITVPAALFNSLAHSDLTSNMAGLSIIGFVLPWVLAGVMYLVTPDLKERPEQRGVMLTGMVVLGVFAYPFFEAFWGSEGLTHIGMYDVGNALFAGSGAVLFSGACGARRQKGITWESVKRMITSPVLLGAMAGLAVSLLNIQLPLIISTSIDKLAAANTPMAMIGVGLFLEPKAAHWSLIGRYAAVRMLLGGLLGWAGALLLGLTGLEIVTAVIASSLPAGTIALVYAGKEGMDTEFAASMISMTILIGIVAINVLPLILGPIYL